MIDKGCSHPLSCRILVHQCADCGDVLLALFGVIVIVAGAIIGVRDWWREHVGWDVESL